MKSFIQAFLPSFPTIFDWSGRKMARTNPENMLNFKIVKT